MPRLRKQVLMIAQNEYLSVRISERPGRGTYSSPPCRETDGERRLASSSTLR